MKRGYFRRDGTPCPEEEALKNGVLQDGYSIGSPVLTRDAASRPGQRVFLADSTFTFDQALADVAPGFDSGVRRFVADMKSNEVFRIQDGAQGARRDAYHLLQLADCARVWTDHQRQAGRALSAHLLKMADEADARLRDMLGRSPHELAYDQRSAELQNNWMSDAHRPRSDNSAPLGDAATEYDRMRQRMGEAWKDRG